MIIVVFGLPGTGKSFFSKHLEKETGACYLNTDMIREKENRKGRYNTKSKQAVYDRLMDLAEEKLREGSDVIVDGTFHKQARRKEISETAKETGHRIYFIETKATEQTVKSRLKTGRKYSEADFQVYKIISNEFEPCQEDHLTLWTDYETVEEMILKAKKYING